MFIFISHDPNGCTWAALGRPRSTLRVSVVGSRGKEFKQHNSLSQQTGSEEKNWKKLSTCAATLDRSYVDAPPAGLETLANARSAVNLAITSYMHGCIQIERRRKNAKQEMQRCAERRMHRTIECRILDASGHGENVAKTAFRFSIAICWQEQQRILGKWAK